MSSRLRGERVPMDARAREHAPGSFVRLRHGLTHVVADGPEPGEPILFGPGATLSLWMWDGLFERLAAAGYRVIRYDRYGMGFSDRPDVEYDQDLFDGQITDLLEVLGLGRPVTLVALAFGGPIAAAYAVRHPERVSRVCLISPDGFATPLNLGARLALLPVVGEPLFRLVGARALKARLPGYSRDERVVDRVRAGFLPELRYRGFKRSLISAIRNIPIHEAESLYRSLNALDMPVQVIWGRQDAATPMPSEELVRAVFSRADLRLLDGVGHLPHYERPDETAAILSAFLQADSFAGSVGGAPLSIVRQYIDQQNRPV